MNTVTPLLQRYLLDHLLMNRVTCIPALDLLALLPDASVDLLLCDLPYAVTACEWDSIIPLAPMWEQFKRVIKPKGAIVLTATQPFTSMLVASNPAMFKYSWVWVKSRATDFVRAKLKPMGQREDVLVFSHASVANGARELVNYYPQGLRRVNRVEKNHANTGGDGLRGGRGFLGRNGSNLGANNKLHNPTYIQEYEGYPSTVLNFDSEIDTVHPTQKPVSLFEYLIKTYTQEGDLVLDPTCGSGTTAVAARNTKRRFVCGDLSPDYVLISRDRLRLPFERRHAPQSDDLSDLPMFAGVA